MAGSRSAASRSMKPSSTSGRWPATIGRSGSSETTTPGGSAAARLRSSASREVARILARNPGGDDDAERARDRREPARDAARRAARAP